MSHFRYRAAAVAALLTMAVPAAAALPEAAIKAENARWAAAYARGDYAAIGKLYTDEGTLLPPGEDRVVGPAAIVAYFVKNADASAPNSVSFSNFEFYGNDDMVTEISDTEVRDHRGKLIVRGKQTLVFLKRGGAWKLHRDIWNDNAPLKPGDR